MIRVIAALLIIGTIASCAKPQDLTFIDISNIRMVKLGLTESEVGLDVRFYNPNNQRVQLKDAAAKVYVNSTYLGDTRMDSTIGVPRRDTFAVPLILNIKTVSTLSKLMQTLSDSTVSIKVEGTVKMGKAGLFKTFPIVYDKVQRVEDLKANFGM
jgi:LEA14-like dessication related protein